ncbi:hypothetical protein G6L68_19375 [Agrobacterium fabrum]|uniref:hypothetical protein n=1 Tax=Agrobacterium fabrum TaxID=1176649 RepID=UPI000EF6212E|nr:hypothetical protein [Agrobacterium fabrum]NTE62818.1 hypothetical protein [Agrobacterium fabrum]
MRLVFIFAADLMSAALVIASNQTGTSVELETERQFNGISKRRFSADHDCERILAMAGRS